MAAGEAVGRFQCLGDLQNYNRVAFETDIPAFDPHCNAVTGAGCSVPAAGMKFYPFYTTSAGDRDDDACRWQLGGKLIPRTENDFGGSPTTAYGKPFFTLFQTGPNSAAPFISVFHRGLDENPCSTSVDSIEDTIEHLMHD